MTPPRPTDTTTSSDSLILLEPQGRENEGVPIEEASLMTHLPRHQIAVYCRYGLISTVSEPVQDGWRFDSESIRALRRFRRLKEKYELNAAGLRYLSEVLDEVERLKRELRHAAHPHPGAERNKPSQPPTTGAIP